MLNLKAVGQDHHYKVACINQLDMLTVNHLTLGKDNTFLEIWSEKSHLRAQEVIISTPQGILLLWTEALLKRIWIPV